MVEPFLFGDLETLSTLPCIVAFTNLSNRAFRIGLRDRRSREDQLLQTYTVRWWAIPGDLGAPLVVVEAPPDVNRATEEAIRFTLADNPGIKRDDLAGTLGIDVNQADTHINNLRTTGKITSSATGILLKQRPAPESLSAGSSAQAV